MTMLIAVCSLRSDRSQRVCIDDRVFFPCT